MYGSGRTTRRGFFAAILFSAAIILSGCATSYNHSFDPAMGYGGLKNYNWVSSTGYSSDLVVKNVQYFADQALEAKGFKKATENPDMLVSVQYENEIGINEYGYRLRMLTIGIQKADSRQIIWRGTATGTINTDAGSGDLKSTVQGILAKFPPAK